MRAFRPVELILSCEHGGNRVPARYRRFFADCEWLLASHRGYDPGALAVARELAAATGAPLFYSTTTRLLIELNRTLDHPQLFSTRATRMTSAMRAELLRRYYLPYWRGVESRVARALRSGHAVVHLSCHSFTPQLAGVERNADVGLLFDPRRALEAEFCRLWRAALRRRAPRLRVRHNYPYQGTTDSLTRALRGKFARRPYLGLALEINQKFPRGERRRWLALLKVLRTTLADVLQSFKARWSG